MSGDGGPAIGASDESAVAVDRTPGRASAAIAGAAITVSVLLLAGTAGIVVAGPGAVVLVLGAQFGSHRAVSYGAGGTVAGVAAGAYTGATAPALIVATLCAIVAWDQARFGVRIGRQLGSSADTARAEVVHAAASLAVGATAGVTGYLAYYAAASGRPVAVLASLLVGATALIVALR